MAKLGVGKMHQRNIICDFMEHSMCGVDIRYEMVDFYGVF